VLILTAVLILLFYSCNPSKTYTNEENAKIQDYLGNNSSLDFELKPSGLYYYQVLEGTGRMAVKHDTAYVRYTGKFLDGTIFDSTTGTTDTLVVPVDEGWLIKGFDEGLTYMRVGGKAIFLMPSKLAYGSSGYLSISGYTPLLFDVELVKIKPGPGK